MINPVHALSAGAKHTIDVVSVGWLLAVFITNLPTITAVAVLIWTGMRMVESWQAIRLNQRKLARSEQGENE